LPTIDERMDDIRAILDAVGSERAVIMGMGWGGPVSIVFAATYPDRVSSLVLYDTYARWRRADDYPFGMPDPACARFEEVVAEMWGSGYTIAGFVPSLADDELARRQWARAERLGASPAQIAGLMETWLNTDVRDVLPSIMVPTLVIQRAGDGQFRVAHGRYLAEKIPGAKYVELPGTDHFPSGDALEAIGGEIEEFVTGRRSAVVADRVLAPGMFTDIVDSTAAAATMGDRAWRNLLEQTGDGVAATFDGPARAITCACAIRDVVRPLGLEVRAGLHTGEIERRAADVSGMGVHIAARVADRAGAGEVLVSSTVKDLVVGSGITFEDRGTHTLKGVPDEWRLLSVVG
jgi:class 3 adenylate cyclase